MTISVENKPNSNIALLKIVGESLDSKCVPFLFPNQKETILPETSERFTRVPVPESTEDELGLVSVSGAREEIPIIETIGRGLDVYIIDSYPEGEGGEINGMSIEPGTVIEEEGIIFEAS